MIEKTEEISRNKPEQKEIENYVNRNDPKDYFGSHYHKWCKYHKNSSYHTFDDRALKHKNEGHQISQDKKWNRKDKTLLLIEPDNKIGIILLEGSINNHLVTCVVDSGADKSFINMELAEKLKLKSTKIAPFNLETADKRKTSINEKPILI